MIPTSPGCRPVPRLRSSFLRPAQFRGLAPVAGILFLILPFSFFQDVADLRAGQAAKARDVRDQRPNILFLIADDWGWNHAGVSGCKWVKTPTFDRIAREGVLFRNAFTSNPKCSPSRATILTGRNTWQLEDACCHYGRFSAKYAVYPDLLARGRLSRRLHRQGLGAGRLEKRRLPPQSGRPRVQPPHLPPAVEAPRDRRPG